MFMQKRYTENPSPYFLRFIINNFLKDLFRRFLPFVEVTSVLLQTLKPKVHKTANETTKM
jgi:hypothetical protein